MGCLCLFLQKWDFFRPVKLHEKSKHGIMPLIFVGQPEKRPDYRGAAPVGEGTRMNHLHHHLVDRKLLRFAAIGTANTILGMGIMFGMYNLLGCGYWASTAANYIITSVISFFANKYLTFHNHQKSVRQAVRFAANILLCYAFAFSVAKPLVIRLMANVRHSVQENVSMLVGMGLFSCCNYLGQRLVVFREVGDT